MTPIRQFRFPVTEPLLSLSAFLTWRKSAVQKKGNLKCLEDRDFVWHHDIKFHTSTFIYKLWQCFNPDCRISSLSPLYYSSSARATLQASFLAHNLPALTFQWLRGRAAPRGHGQHRDSFASSQELSHLEGRNVLLHKHVSNTQQSPEVLRGYPVCNALCNIQHTDSLTLS